MMVDQLEREAIRKAYKGEPTNYLPEARNALVSVFTDIDNLTKDEAKKTQEKAR